MNFGFEALSLGFRKKVSIVANEFVFFFVAGLAEALEEEEKEKEEEEEALMLAPLFFLFLSAARPIVDGLLDPLFEKPHQLLFHLFPFFLCFPVGPPVGPTGWANR